MGAVRRVAVVGDREIVRLGRCSALGAASDLEVVACSPTAEVLAWRRRWREVDAVVVDVYDGSRPFDRFAGVQVVERLRALDLPAPPVVHAVGLSVDNPYLTLRLAEAGADQLHLLGELDSAACLQQAVRRPEACRRPDAPTARAQIPGLGGPTRVNEVLRRLGDQGLAAAFEPDLPQVCSGFSRRQHINARVLVHRLARLEGEPRYRTGGRQQRGEVPTWREVVRFVNRARGLDLASAV